MTSAPVNIARRGLVFVLSSPSGAGKSTLARELRGADDELEISISVTTRARRPSEIPDRHYHFIDAEAFARMRDRDELLEWAEVHGNFYGTPRAPVEKALGAGRDVLFDIDWQGTEQLSAIERLRPDLVRVFVLPPSYGELHARLDRRAEDSPETISKRLRNARLEITKWESYDYVIVNDDLDRSLTQVRAILTSERIRRDRVTGLSGFVDGLLSEASMAQQGEQDLSD